MKKIILASSSPRRRALLNQIGLKFTVDASNIEEKLNPRLKPRGNAEQLSVQKAQAVAGKYNSTVSHTTGENEEYIILAADTFVVIDDEIIGKPADEKHARRVLRKLSGREHSVITGFTIIDTGTGKTVTESVETKVFFRKLSNRDIDSYIKTKEPMGVAGAYRIQEKGSVLIEKIEGDYFNIVGLPVSAIAESLKKFEIEVL